MPHPSGRPWIIAHRGASHRARENTIQAFELAAQLGADAVELDVRRTADGVLVVHHDDTLHGTDTPIVELTRDEIGRLDPEVPDLAAALRACRGMWVDVEIKNDPREADWDPDDHVAATIADAYQSANIIVTSFNPSTAAVARQRGLRTGLLVGRGIDPAEAAPAAAETGHEFLLPHHSTLGGDHGRHIVEAAADVGIEVIAWTVDDPEAMRRLASLGVGGLATNTPDVAVSVLEKGHR